ncbi:CoA-transferase [Streptomyces sp. CA-106131]|uniref:CoA-transferase n=1 Tax=Streptomyces sp. CA-106131 TaxID=3240045 RepID=UPI003D8A2470
MTARPSFPLTADGPVLRGPLVYEWDARLEAVPEQSKVEGLAQAVRSAVQPGDAVYLGGSLARPNAATFELTRQMHGTDPRLTIIAPAIGNQHAVLVAAGLVAKVITSLHGNTFPAPGPNPVFTQADQTGAVTFEDWSMLTLVQRLYAAATGVPFLPTRSLVGTDLGDQLTEAGLLRVVDDPYGGEETALVPPLHPDVTFVHALLADTAGNAVICPPYYEDAWAAFATRRAVIVTAEKIVSTDVIRRYAQFVKVPGAVVTAVCEAPFGSHPHQLPGELVPETGGYHDDYEFLDELRVVCRDPEALTAWIKRWILDLPDHDAYLGQLGPDRLQRLRGSTAADSWQTELHGLEERWSDSPTNGELTAILGGRYVHRLVTQENLRLALAGVGVSTLAAWLAADALRAEGVEFDLLAEGGMYGYTPLPLDPYLFNYRNMSTSTSLSNVQTILGVLVGGFNSRAVGVLGAAQVDRHGSINTSRIRGRMLTGSGGGNDIASSARAVVVTTTHDRARLPETVDFVTSPGHGVRAIVTDRAVIERQESDGQFVLTGVLDRDSLPKDDLVREAVDRCGWTLPVARDVSVLAAVDGREVAAVRTYDPAGNFVR